jgi:hypothetical protein
MFSGSACAVHAADIGNSQSLASAYKAVPSAKEVPLVNVAQASLQGRISTRPRSNTKVAAVMTSFGTALSARFRKSC